MRRISASSLSVVLAVVATAVNGQTLPSTAGNYEVSPLLKASEILQPAYLSGPNHKVREEVTSYLGANRFVINSPFGTFVAQGNQMLHDRVVEIAALAKLRDMSNTSQYAEGFKEAAKVPFEAVGDLVTSPVGTVTAVPKGVGKFLGRVGRGAKESVSGRDRGEGEDGMVKQASGVSQTKRELCAELGVNPYSSNEILQQELDRVARVITFGKLTVKAALLPVGGAAGAALSALSAVDVTNNIVYTQNPIDLRKSNLGRLKDMGISAKDAEAFLANSNFTPWHQTRIVTGLERMTGVKGREVLLRDATAMTENETDAVFYEQTARLIGHAHAHGVVVDRIILLNGFPVCIGPDGGVIVALQWDYAMWSPRSEKFASALQALQVNGAKPPSLIVVLTGAMSPRLKQELETRGFRVQDKLVKGPLN